MELHSCKKILPSNKLLCICLSFQSVVSVFNISGNSWAIYIKHLTQILHADNTAYIWSEVKSVYFYCAHSQQIFSQDTLQWIQLFSNQSNTIWLCRQVKIMWQILIPSCLCILHSSESSLSCSSFRVCIWVPCLPLLCALVSHFSSLVYFSYLNDPVGLSSFSYLHSICSSAFPQSLSHHPVLL